jgi:hypothetical protein
VIDHSYYSKISLGCLNYTDIERKGDLSEDRVNYVGESMLDLFASSLLTPIWCMQNKIESLHYFLPAYHEYKIWGALYGVTLHVQGEAITIIQTETDAYVCYVETDRKPDGGYDYYYYQTEVPLTTIHRDLETGLKVVRAQKQLQDEIDELTR